MEGSPCAGINEPGCRVQGQRVRARVREAAQASARDRGHAAAVVFTTFTAAAGRNIYTVTADLRASGDQEGRSSLGRSGRRSRPAGRLALHLGLARSAAVGVHSVQRRAAVAGDAAGEHGLVARRRPVLAGVAARSLPLIARAKDSCLHGAKTVAGPGSRQST